MSAYAALGAILNKKTSRLLLTISMLTLFYGAHASAKETLLFAKAPPSKSDALHLQQELSEQFQNFSFASTDLNHDGVNEYVAKSTTCNKETSFCSYKIYSILDNKAVLLGLFDARSILISDVEKNGVRQILAYQNTLNDYDHTAYIWSPVHSQFKQSGQLSNNAGMR